MSHYHNQYCLRIWRENRHTLMWCHGDKMYFSRSYLAKRKAVRRDRWARESAKPLVQPVVLFSSSHGECHVRQRPAFPRTPDILLFSKSGRTASDSLKIVDDGKLHFPRTYCIRFPENRGWRQAPLPTKRISCCRLAGGKQHKLLPWPLYAPSRQVQGNGGQPHPPSSKDEDLDKTCYNLHHTAPAQGQ